MIRTLPSIWLLALARSGRRLKMAAHFRRPGSSVPRSRIVEANVLYHSLLGLRGAVDLSCTVVRNGRFSSSDGSAISQVVPSRTPFWGLTKSPGQALVSTGSLDVVNDEEFE